MENTCIYSNQMANPIEYFESQMLSITQTAAEVGLSKVVSLLMGQPLDALADFWLQLTLCNTLLAASSLGRCTTLGWSANAPYHKQGSQVGQI